MFNKYKKIIWIFIFFYSSQGVCENSMFHYSIGAGYDFGGDHLTKDIKANEGYYVDFGIEHNVGKLNNIRLSYVRKFSGVNTKPNNFDTTSNPMSTDSERVSKFSSRYLKLVGYQSLNNFHFGVGVSYHYT